MSGSLTMYRRRVPAHENVDDEIVEDALSDAAARHSASALGANYVLACIWWAAHWVQITPGSGATGAGCSGAAATTCFTGSVSSRSGRSAPVCKDVRAPPGGMTTVYWERYLDLIDTRAASAPSHTSVR